MRPPGPELASTAAGWDILPMRHRLARRPGPALGMLVALCAACGGTSDTRAEVSVADSTYISIMVELMLLDTDPSVSPSEAGETALDSLRAEVLRGHGVSASEVLAFARAAGTDPLRMQTIWERITQVYDSARIARLRSTSEARSESEGKLGADARAREADTARSITPGSDTVAVPTRREKVVPARLDSILEDRKRRLRPPPSDTTG